MIIDNLILIKGGSYNDIKKALRQWIDLYSTDLQVGLTFHIFKNGHGKHFIQADIRLDNERFFYLVNYLKYPEDIEYKIEIEGYTTGKGNNQLSGKDLLVYNSSSEKEYDKVFITTSENENFKMDLGGKIKETSHKRKFNFPTDLIIENPETIMINQKEIEHKADKINEKSINKRFKVLSIITLSLTLIGIIIHQIDPQNFREFSNFLGMGIGLWFFGDYKMLQSNKHYLYSLVIALGYFLHILTANGEFNKIILVGPLSPLTLLIVQKPARLFYKALLNREPVFDRPPPTFWDGIYIMVLFLGLILPFIMMDNLIK